MVSQVIAACIRQISDEIGSNEELEEYGVVTPLTKATMKSSSLAQYQQTPTLVSKIQCQQSWSGWVTLACKYVPSFSINCLLHTGGSYSYSISALSHWDFLIYFCRSNYLRFHNRLPVSYQNSPLSQNTIPFNNTMDHQTQPLLLFHHLAS